MTTPSPDAQPPRLLPRRPVMVPPTHSIPDQQAFFPPPSSSFTPMTPPSSPFTNGAQKHMFEEAVQEPVIDFATHSLDLATGGLKTLTAKREFPVRPDRRTTGTNIEETAAHSYMLAMVIMFFVILMLIGGGIVLFVMLQP